MNKTKTRTRLSALFAVLLAIMIAVPAILQSGADAAVNRKRPTKVTLTSAKATSYNKVSLKWKKSKNITSYAVYYKASNSKKWVKIANVSSKKTGYTHKSSKKYPLKQGKTYQYRIRGYNKKAKGSKKYGKYSSTKKVKIPKKAAAKPTEAPKPTVKPTEVPKPTAAPKPTVTPKPTAVPKPTAAPKPTVTPIPKPTAIPKPTQIPQPTKPVQPAKPTATPIPKPTAVPKPTEGPKPTATPRPTATPTATPTPTPAQSNVDVITITGGEAKNIGPTKTKFPNFSDFSNVTFDIQNSSSVIDCGPAAYNSRSATVSIQGLRQGNATITAKHNGSILKVYKITVTSDWKEYLGYYNWRRNTESQIWTNSMSVVQKLDAAKDYIKTNFKYSTSAGGAIYAYPNKVANCITASEIFGDMAKDLNVRVGYINMYTQKIYDYLTAAVSAADGHIYNAVMLDGSWVGYDAQPPHV